MKQQAIVWEKYGEMWYDALTLFLWGINENDELPFPGFKVKTTIWTYLCFAQDN